MEEDKLDKYFQEKLAGHTEEPPPAVWESIDHGLPEGGYFWKKRLLMILLLLLSIGSAGYLGYRLYQVDSRVAELENQIKKSEGSSELSPSQNSTSRLSEKNSDVPEAKASDLTALNSSIEKEKNNAPVMDHLRAEENQPENELGKNQVNDKPVSIKEKSKTGEVSSLLETGSKRKSESGMQLRNENTFSKSKEEDQVNANWSRINTGDASVSKNKKPLTFNLLEFKKIKSSSRITSDFTLEKRETDYVPEPGKDWYLYIYGMASYTHRRVVAMAEGSEALPNRLDKVENGLITPGAGVQVSRELGESFRLSFGVEYNQWIQEGSYPANVSVSEVELVNNPATQVQEFNFDSQIFSSLGTSDFSSSSSENPFTTGFETLSPTDQVAFEIDARRNIEYLSIPLTLEYVFNAYPFTFTAGAGISINPVIGSTTTYFAPDSLPDLSFSDKEDFSGTYLSFHGGVAVEYGISEHMSLRINPVYRGWMNPIFENEAIRTLPFGVAIRAGLVYQFGQK